MLGVLGLKILSAEASTPLATFPIQPARFLGGGEREGR